MIIRTPRSRLAAFIDTVLTAIAWIAFIYLFGSGILSVLLDEGSGPRVSFMDRLLPSAGTITIYLAVAIVNAAVLLAWAIYNGFRFKGTDRRSRSEPLDEARLARGFGVDVAMRLRSERARIMTVHHTDEGAIKRIKFELVNAPMAVGQAY
jgi:biofilm PGA synthesis protein PgaD